MGVAWVGNLPRQWVWGCSPQEAVDFFFSSVKILTFW